MTEEQKATRLMIAAQLAQAAHEQVREIITTPEHVETLGGILIALEDVIQKAPGLAQALTPDTPP